MKLTKAIKVLFQRNSAPESSAWSLQWDRMSWGRGKKLKKTESKQQKNSD